MLMFDTYKLKIISWFIDRLERCVSISNQDCFVFIFISISLTTAINGSNTQENVVL